MCHRTYDAGVLLLSLMLLLPLSLQFSCRRCADFSCVSRLVAIDQHDLNIFMLGLLKVSGALPCNRAGC